jgi:hypothetical protein
MADDNPEQIQREKDSKKDHGLHPFTSKLDRS